MGTRFFSCFLIFVLISCVSCSANPTHLSRLHNKNLTSANPSTKALEFLGNVDGKSYFYDSVVKLDWYEAKAYCSGVGMRLATITTREQYNFLKLKNNAEELNSWYWTAGRESRTLGMIVYDGDGQTQPLADWESSMRDYLNEKYYFCVQYFASRGSAHWINLIPCNGKYGVLCEA